MLPPHHTSHHLRFYVLLTAIFLIGTYLRVASLGEQILLDDEWHGLIAVIGKTYIEVLTDYNPHDYSSPLLNLWSLFLYNSYNWSELSLRLPLLLAGLASLIVIPALVRGLFGERAGILVGLLTAISPHMVFYSRYNRGYALALLFGFWAVFLFIRYLYSGDWRHAAGFMAASALALLGHPFSLAAVAAPFAPAFFLVRKPKPRFAPTAVSFKNLVYLAAGLACVTALILSPMLKGLNELPWHGSDITPETLGLAASLVSGTGSLPLVLSFWLFCAAGFYYGMTSRPAAMWIFLSVAGFYSAAVVASRPVGISAGAVLVRYTIVLVPVFLTLAAVGMDRLLSSISKRFGPSAAAFPVALYVALSFYFGPLPSLYAGTNNFMNHSAFQWSYAYRAWEKSPSNHIYSHRSVTADAIPPFYKWLERQPDIQAILVHPFDVCDYNNFQYFYQLFHGKKTYAGYCDDPRLLGYGIPRAEMFSGGEELAVGKLSADEVLSRVSDHGRLNFETLVNVNQIESVKNSRADVLVLQKHLLALRIGRDARSSIPVYYKSTAMLSGRFNSIWGDPAYEDESIVCYRIRR